MNVLLEGSYWPQTIDTGISYSRRHDDTDGKTGPDQEIEITLGPDGDAWVLLANMSSLRFRTWAGGGSSLRVRNALLVLAEAIRRDNAERPQQQQQ
jgi:hypothetical protein